MMNARFFEAVATLVGTVIGAGVLGIPYVVAQSGLGVGLLYIVGIGLAVMLSNLLLGEVVLSTKGNHQLTGYAEKYLGSKGKMIMALAMIVGTYGALLAYMIGVGSALNAIVPEITPLAGSLAFFAFGIGVIYIGLKAVERSELLMAFFVIAIITVIAVVAFVSDAFSPGNFTGMSLPNAFIPYGVILFAFLGAVAIPEMKQELGNRKKLLKKAIIIGGIIPIILYTVFTVAIVGISGQNTAQIATINLGENLGAVMAAFANVFAVLAMSTSFIALGLALKQMYVFDFGFDNKTAWMMTCSVPLLAFLIGIKSFIVVLGVAGGLAGGIEGLLLVLMHRAVQSRKPEIKPEYKIHATRVMVIGIGTMYSLGLFYVVYGVLRNII
jgi:tyrosine-specific transport protein